MASFLPFQSSLTILSVDASPVPAILESRLAHILRVFWTLPATMSMSAEVFTGEILLSQVENRQYRHITLPNSLPCLLVHDPETEKSSACCDVLVGSLCDPAEAQGLAHFLEHMLFMGTSTYPVENAYSAFLSAHGGFSNAYTSQENTVYYFDVQPDHFERALDMFACFFTCPLLSPDATDREMNAVDSENSKNLQSDSWRRFQLLKSLARPDHPINSFSTGSLETLKTAPEAAGLNTRDLVMAFYKKHYR
jgi:insulysin